MIAARRPKPEGAEDRPRSPPVEVVSVVVAGDTAAHEISPRATMLMNRGVGSGDLPGEWKR